MKIQSKLFVKSLLILITVLLLAPNAVYAKRVGGLFGTDEKIKRIQDLELTDANGDSLYLAYKTTSTFFFLGVYFSDDGYVLGIEKSFGSYYPLNQEKIKALQESGLLDTPLPEYSISTFDRVFGFSLWIVVAVLLAVRFYPSSEDEVPDESEYLNKGNKPIRSKEQH